MIEVVLDTETTGLKVEEGHRIVEIGCIELENLIPTGKKFHYYINPERESDVEAEKIHGLSKEFLSDKPIFSEIVEEFIAFISDSKIIIHNASFDLGFINAELLRCNMQKLNEASIIDTLQLAKKKFIGQSVSLDALCRKYNIDLSDREVHGALKDAKLLASVYLELIGGRQSRLKFDNEDFIKEKTLEESKNDINGYYKNLSMKKINKVSINQSDFQLHLKSIQEIKNSIWEKL